MLDSVEDSGSKRMTGRSLDGGRGPWTRRTVRETGVARLI